MIEASNTLWQKRDQILNWNIPLKLDGDISYWGWNECAASYKNGDDNLDKHWDETADAALIILPPMDTSSVPDGYHFSLCDLSDHALDVLLYDLKRSWEKGWASKPILIMEQTSGMDPDDCATYWDSTKSTCDDGYRKGIFSQNFYFSDGSCLLVADDSEVYFYNADPTSNTKHSQKDMKHCCAAWPQFCDVVGAEPEPLSAEEDPEVADDLNDSKGIGESDPTTSSSITADVSTLLILLPVGFHYFLV